WEAKHRIEILADMRNSALRPLYESSPDGLAPDGVPWTGIVFYNDVYLSAIHVLELMHQQLQQDADMTCGWDHAGRWFYDGWVGRDMSGDLYTPFPVKEEAKDLPQVLFPSHPPTKRRYDKNLPFQVFAGWNGIAVINPRPFFPPFNVRFRRGAAATDGRTAADNECQMSESSFISWDFWKYGFSRIQVIPGVHACYGKEDAQMRGWVEWPMPDSDDQELIWWNEIPPQKVRCHDWPDKPGKGWWAWDTVRWVNPPDLEEL
ncbi:cryptococcal mannosyltransferase 1-domain-containing protein, partial [Naematelia encephala]